MNLSLTPEEQLVLAAMKLKPTAEELARMERLVAEVQDWNYCTRLAIDRGIGPLLNHKIPMLGNSHLIPADAQARLQQSYLRTLARSMRLYEAFREVGTALNKAGIKFVALKGVYLAEALYEDIGLRLFSDIDLLVAEEDGERSLEVLREVGYEKTGEIQFQSKFVKSHRKLVHYPPMVRDDISIEVHIRLHNQSSDYELDIPVILKGALPTTIYGIKTYTLQPYDQLIFLIVHADKHFKNGQFQLKSYADILNFFELNRNYLETNEFHERCNLFKCTNIVQISILLITMLTWNNDFNFNWQIPKKTISDHFLNKFFILFRDDNVKVNPADTLHTELKSISGMKAKLKYFWNVVHPAKSFMTHRYKIKNPANYRVYYLVRYWEGAKALLKSVIAFIPGRKSV